VPRRRRRSLKRLGFLGLLLGLSLWFWKVWGTLPSRPQAILVLGGGTAREKYAAVLGHHHPDLPIWVSSGTNPEYAQWLFREARIEPRRLHLDYRAVDTVSNFTTLADQLRQQGIRRVYLVTSDYHMRRALTIGTIVFGSRGIALDPRPVPTGKDPEPLSRAARDGARALLWLVTGDSGDRWALENGVPQTLRRVWPNALDPGAR
jgi:uncharacterized SAM-binding protein YcdF (DUF218 family)